MCFIKKPIIRREVSISELYGILNEALDGDGEIYLSDNNFWLCDISDIDRFLKQDKTNRNKYREEVYDCDDFAKRLYGQFAIPEWSHLAFGLIWTAKHAMNICVDTNGDVWYIEPQNDKRRSELKERYGEFRFVII